MSFKRWFQWGLILLPCIAWGCQGEVPVAMNDPDKSKSKSEAPPNKSDGENGFMPLVFADFTAFVDGPEGDEPTWSLADSGVIQTTGTPRGYLYTNKTFGNFTLRGEFRYVPIEESPDASAMDKYNTGFLIYVPEEHKKWPRSLEVQGRHDQIGLVKSNARDVVIAAEDDQPARESARNPVGEWNTIEIVSEGGAVTAILNGTKISASEAGELKTGHIGLQAEDFPVEFKNLRIRED